VDLANCDNYAGNRLELSLTIVIIRQRAERAKLTLASSIRTPSRTLSPTLAMTIWGPPMTRAGIDSSVSLTCA
jgi:hypothetical protein